MSKRQIHETVLVHDITGEPRNKLEQMSVPFGSQERIPQGFSYSYGWMDKSGSKWSLYTREITLDD